MNPFDTFRNPELLKQQQPQVRPLSAIALEILTEWPNISPYAEPYARAMLHLADMKSVYYNDDAKSVVLYFLANAGTWRGETAKRIKAELKKMAGVK